MEIAEELREKKDFGDNGDPMSPKSQHHPNNEEHNLSPESEKDETALEWTRTHESQHRATLGTTQESKQSTAPLPPMGAGRPYPPDLPGQEMYLVEFNGADDPSHPQNWSMTVRLVPAKLQR
jgi:DHA1 family multidrug resistance protein-like MFS transporter